MTDFASRCAAAELVNGPLARRPPVESRCITIPDRCNAGRCHHNDRRVCPARPACCRMCRRALAVLSCESPMACGRPRLPARVALPVDSTSGADKQGRRLEQGRWTGTGSAQGCRTPGLVRGRGRSPDHRRGSLSDVRRGLRATARLLTALRRHRTRPSSSPAGPARNSNPGEIRRMHRDGHAIGLPAWWHPSAHRRDARSVSTLKADHHRSGRRWSFDGAHHAPAVRDLIDARVARTSISLGFQPQSPWTPHIEDCGARLVDAG